MEGHIIIVTEWQKNYDKLHMKIFAVALDPQAKNIISPPPMGEGDKPNPWQ